MPGSPIPDGYELRGYLPGDEDSWVDLYNAGGFGTPWDRARFDEYMTEPERKEGSRIIARSARACTMAEPALEKAGGDRILAATFASVEVGMDRTGRVDFVVSHPEVRGLGLGRAVCSGVVRYLIDKGYDNVILYTDDWRIPAIGLYLSMGFEPQMNRSDMPGRWQRVMEQLVARSARALPEVRR